MPGDRGQSAGENRIMGEPCKKTLKRLKYLFKKANYRESMYSYTLSSA